MFYVIRVAKGCHRTIPSWGQYFQFIKCDHAIYKAK